MERILNMNSLHISIQTLEVGQIDYNMNSLCISIQTLKVGQIGYNLWCILKKTNSTMHAISFDFHFAM